MTSATALETRAEPLGDAFDLLAAYRPPGVLFERRGLGVAGSVEGLAGSFTAPDYAGLRRVVDVLRRATRRRGDVAPFAVGALGFLSGVDSSHELVVPRHGVRRDARGRTWRVETGPVDAASDDPPAFEAVARVAPHEPFAEIQLREVPAASVYGEAVAAAVARIRGSDLRKVVLARTLEVEAGRTLDPRLLAQRLRAVDPDAYTFAAPMDDGVIVGASPELLVSRRVTEVRSNPLAGSAPRSGDPDEDRANADGLVESAKEQEEHVIVVEAVAEILGPSCSELTWDPEPVLLETPNVWHLSTRFRGTLREPPPSALDLVAELHPTPAIAGTPTTTALSTIEELEPFDRGRYAGPVGWVDAEGDGEWAIALRCAELRRDRATLFSGAGIVADSEPAREVDETERKFRAFLDALRWG
jgi:isochorismate synthase